MNDRIEGLKNMLMEDPEDPFLHYAIGLEYVKERQLDCAAEKFLRILTEAPDYLPVYYQAAHLMIEKGDVLKAEKIFKDGIELARRKSDVKTLQELSTAYTNFITELDEE